MDAVQQAGYSVPQQSLELSIDGMTCASCVGRVERALAKVPGVKSVSVNLANERAHLELLGQVDPQTLIAAVDQGRLLRQRLGSRTPAQPTINNSACTASAGP